MFIMRTILTLALLMCLSACARGPVLPLTELAEVAPTRETTPVASSGDAADDSAIWVHPEDATQSLIVGTNKDRALVVYALDGSAVSRLAAGKPNNVDLRRGFPLAGREIVLVAASDRSDNTLALYELRTNQKVLRPLAAIPTGLDAPYGLCLYHSTNDGAFYAFVNDKDGRMRQWRLRGNASGGIEAELVRGFDIGSQPEGCVADDELATLYVGEEQVGVWRYGAEPDRGAAREMVDGVGNSRLVADVEGLGLYEQDSGAGYLVVSSQGNHSYALYTRGDGNSYIGSFRVGAGRGIDGVQETDGLAVVSADLGSDYPDGLLVVQDGANTDPEANQNFKYVSWREVIEAMSLN